MSSERYVGKYYPTSRNWHGFSTKICSICSRVGLVIQQDPLFSWPHGMPMKVEALGAFFKPKCADRVESKPPLFHRGWETQPNSRGLYIYIPIIRIPYFSGWMSLSPIQGVDRPWHKWMLLVFSSILGGLGEEPLVGVSQ